MVMMMMLGGSGGSSSGGGSSGGSRSTDCVSAKHENVKREAYQACTRKRCGK